MRIKKIVVKGLFGQFNHSIPLKSKERITIIHGPNGVGKTTVLKLLENILRRDFVSVNKVPFRDVTISFNNSTTLKITRPDSDRKSPRAIQATLKERGKEKEDHEIPIARLSERQLVKETGIPINIIDEFIPSLRRVGATEWFDESTGDAISFYEVMLRYGDSFPGKFDRFFKIPEKIDKLLRAIPVYFIQTQRLLSSDPIDEEYRYGRGKHQTRTRPVVQKWAAELANRIQDRLRESGSLSASLDRQLPSTLLTSSLPEIANESKIREMYREQTSYRDRLMKAGLIEDEELIDLPPGQIEQSERKVLWFYLNDINKKLIVFDDLLNRIELIKEIINTRFLFKSFTADKEDGFLFTSENGSLIPLTALSSGEQHELVLAYELIFKVPESSLILIDEPELSLHVTWQHKFLDDITRISELVDLDFLIATHSPAIIHDRTDLMTPLS